MCGRRRGRGEWQWAIINYIDHHPSGEDDEETPDKRGILIKRWVGGEKERAVCPPINAVLRWGRKGKVQKFVLVMV